MKSFIQKKNVTEGKKGKRSVVCSGVFYWMDFTERDKNWFNRLVKRVILEYLKRKMVSSEAS